jgi:hypothetical protein
MSAKPEIVAGTETENQANFSPATAGPPPDPFNPEALRLSPDFEQMSGVKKVLNNISVRRPNDQEWFDVSPDPAYRGTYAALKLKAENEYYLMTEEMGLMLGEETIRVTIYTVMTKSGVLLLWPVRLPSAQERRPDKWSASAHEAAAEGMKRRIRIKANMGAGFYDLFTSKSTMRSTDPVWPTETFFELLRIGFAKEGRFIWNLDHPVLKQLRDG